MATTRKPRTTKAKEDPQPEQHNEEPTQIKVINEPETSIKIRPDLYERMMKIGDQKYWEGVLERYTHELAKRYRR